MFVGLVNEDFSISYQPNHDGKKTLNKITLAHESLNVFQHHEHHDVSKHSL